MKDKTILGSWCTEPNCKFIDSKHIQIELVAHIWYSYDNYSKSDMINKKICFVKEIVFDELNDEVEILEEEKKIPEKLNISNFPKHNNSLKKTAIKLNEIIDYLKSKGE